MFHFMKYSVRLTNLVDANKMPPRTSSLQPNRIGAMHSEYIILKAINLDIPVGSFFKIGREERDNEKDVEEQIEEKIIRSRVVDAVWYCTYVVITACSEEDFDEQTATV
jgi:hypothetical protein